MPEDDYVVTTKRWPCLAGIVLGAALLYLGLDLHFFHALRGWRVGPNHVLWIIFSAAGLLLLISSVKTLLSPRTLLRADSQGITLYAGNIAVELGTKSSVKPPRRDDPCLIPWNQIRVIGAGKILTGTQTRKGTGYRVDALGGTLTVGAQSQQQFAEALQVLCDRSVQLDGFGTSGVSCTWTGYAEEDLRQMSREDRDRLRPEDLHSGFVFHHAYLNGNLNHAITVLEELRRRYRPA